MFAQRKLLDLVIGNFDSSIVVLGDERLSTVSPVVAVVAPMSWRISG